MGFTEKTFQAKLVPNRHSLKPGGSASFKKSEPGKQSGHACPEFSSRGTAFPLPVFLLQPDRQNTWAQASYLRICARRVPGRLQSAWYRCTVHGLVGYAGPGGRLLDTQCVRYGSYFTPLSVQL